MAGGKQNQPPEVVETAHPSTLAEGALGELPFGLENDLELPTETPLE